MGTVFKLAVATFRYFLERRNAVTALLADTAFLSYKIRHFKLK